MHTFSFQWKKAIRCQAMKQTHMYLLSPSHLIHRLRHTLRVNTALWIRVLAWGLSARPLFARVKTLSIYWPDKCTSWDKWANSCGCALSITLLRLHEHWKWRRIFKYGVSQENKVILVLFHQGREGGWVDFFSIIWTAVLHYFKNFNTSFKL